MDVDKREKIKLIKALREDGITYKEIAEHLDIAPGSCWRLGNDYDSAGVAQKSRRKEKSKVLEILGGKCVRCGMEDERCLQIDHIQGNPKGEGSFYAKRKILAGELEEYQLLCANCNWIKRAELGEHRGYFDK